MRRVLCQPWISAFLVVAYGLVFAPAFLAGHHPTPGQSLFAVVLVVAGAAAYRFPVHVAAHIKLYLTTPALLIEAVVLPPGVAVQAILITVMAGNTLIRKRNGLLVSDIVNEGLRWGAAGALGSLLFHELPTGWQPAPLVLAAATMYLLDIATITIIVGSMDDRSLLSILRDALDNWRFEGAMYLIGALGALDAGYRPWTLVLLVVPSILIYRAVKNTYELQGSTRRLIEGLADTVDLRDSYSGGHSKRVAGYAELMTNALSEQGKMGPLESELILTAARVHDIGKIEIPDAILHKVGKLSDEEAEVLASHVDRGAEILQCYPNFRRGVPLVRHHHERWDGSGYPHHLARHDIPLGARIIAVADAWDALTSERPYRPALARERAASVLRNGRGTEYDPQLVDLFLNCLGVAPATHLQLVRPDADEVIETA